MDSILNKLTEIESAAVSIVQHAEAEKSILDEKYDEKRRQFDLELESETKKQIQAIQDDLQKKTSQILSSQSDESLAQINALGCGNLPVCVAKTQYSLSDDPKKLGRPSGFTVNVREVYVSAGAEFVVAVNGSIMTMPGLPKKPAAFGIDVDANGTITGLF